MPELNTISANNNLEPGELIAKLAQERAGKYGGLYAKNQAPISPYKNLTSNKEPEKSLISWLRGVNKCNQFVGDVLTKAGFKMPTFKMKDNSEHYMNAESLPKQAKYFDAVCDLKELRAGDLVIIDDLSRKGENGAHVEIVSFVDIARKFLNLIGARKDGAEQRDSNLLRELFSENCEFLRPSKNQKVYFLRPKLRN